MLHLHGAAKEVNYYSFAGFKSNPTLNIKKPNQNHVVCFRFPYKSGVLNISKLRKYGSF